MSDLYTAAREALGFLDNCDLADSFNPPTAQWGLKVRDALRAALDAGQAQAVAPAGWKLVPVEPTPEMLMADLGLRKWDGLPSLESRVDLRPHIYRAMLSAAPPAPAAQPLKERPS